MKIKTIQYCIYMLVVIVIVITAVAYIVTATQSQPALPQTQIPAESIIPEGWKQYDSSAYNFTVLYPTDYTVKEDHTYTALGPGKDISGVAFIVPESITKGTNLSTDSYMSVEQTTDKDCLAQNFLDQVTQSETIIENGRTYTMAIGNGAGAGNRYDETVYATKVNDSCYGLRLFVHYSVLENYDPGTVTEFNHTLLNDNFKQFRSSFDSK
jgi:hypothetical protein